jgi:hypothetical protein
MKPLPEELAGLQIASPQQFRNLTLFSLSRNEPIPAAPDYLLADEAMGRGLARVTEVDGGSVPELRFENHSDQPILLLDGEELVGAKQNRVLNLTILVAAKQTTLIPVSCVEAGRWHMDSAEFRAASHVMYSRGRAARVTQVSASMRASGSRRSDQGAVWEDIAAKSARMNTDSPTQAMSAVFERHAISVEEYVRAFACRENQCGVAFAVGAEIGVDLFDHPATMRSLFAKLVRSYALDALDLAKAPGHEGSIDPAAFLKALAGVPAASEPAIGMGKDVRLAGKSVSGAALWAGGRYVHICGFSVGQGSKENSGETRLSRPTRRRTGRGI